MKLVECIPNFSEGRNTAVIEHIVSVISSAGVHVLDVSSDADHHRTVVTFAGSPDVVSEAAFRAVQAAAQLINLDVHQGVHPRIGATDVMPFVPLRGVSLEDCAALARMLGKRIGEELQIPVYLYEAAASREERVNLADVRRHRYEQLRQTIQEDPARQPDYGPSRLGTAGAVAVGARGPLIAFNAYLDTADVEIAEKIARAVRTSGGGLPALKALGLLVDKSAQVSMNVIDYRKTSLLTVLDAVRAQAAIHGVRVTHTELVGLTPRAALIDAALAALQLPLTARDLVLETQLGHATGDYHDVIFE